MKPLTLVVTLLGLAATSSVRAESHKFVPTVFYNTFSSGHPPELRIKSGERVITTTVDGAGVGADGKTVADGPNPVPKHDGEIRDGEPIVLDDLKITPVAVPGHTPGSMGFIFPVKDQGTPRTAALFGGAWLTPQILSDEALQTFLASVGRFKDATKGARVDVMLQNHMLMAPIQEKLDKLAVRKKGEPNPFVVGATEYQKFLDVMEGCTRVNLARRKP